MGENIDKKSLYWQDLCLNLSFKQLFIMLTVLDEYNNST